MGVELAHHVADDAGAFLVALARIEPQNAHGVDDAPMDGLQAIAHIGQRPPHDRRQRIGEVTLLECRLQVDRFDVAAARRRLYSLAHAAGLGQDCDRNNSGTWLFKDL